jgi:hypothetical protein
MPRSIRSKEEESSGRTRRDYKYISIPLWQYATIRAAVKKHGLKYGVDSVNAAVRDMIKELTAAIEKTDGYIEARDIAVERSLMEKEEEEKEEKEKEK